MCINANIFPTLFVKCVNEIAKLSTDWTRIAQSERNLSPIVAVEGVIN